MNLSRPRGVNASRANIIGYKFNLAVASVLITIVSTLSFAGTAAADSVNGYGEGGIAITVNTGGKSNGSQWVSSITIFDRGRGYCDRADPIEAWAGSVWYSKSNVCPGGQSFAINRWVPSGSGVCGSFWRYYWYDNWPFKPYTKHFRHVACITIRA